MTVDSITEFGALIRSERKQKGWSQKELASRVGVSPLWISQFERGKPTAHIGLVLRTLKTLGVQLWAEDNPKNRLSPSGISVDLDKILQPDPPLITASEYKNQRETKMEKHFTE